MFLFDNGSPIVCALMEISSPTIDLRWKRGKHKMSHAVNNGGHMLTRHTFTDICSTCFLKANPDVLRLLWELKDHLISVLSTIYTRALGRAHNKESMLRKFNTHRTR